MFEWCRNRRSVAAETRHGPLFSSGRESVEATSSSQTKEALEAVGAYCFATKILRLREIRVAIVWNTSHAT